MPLGHHGGLRWRWRLVVIPLIAVTCGACARTPGHEANDSLTTELLDSVQCWCSPLWGHNASKIVEGKNGELYAALFSGEYPDGRVRIMKRTAGGTWNSGCVMSGAYQPSLLFIDDDGRLNVIQNSQEAPLKQLRSADDTNLASFETVAAGNGQKDGRGWYVGAGIRHDTVFMAYILLSYDLFLTWKRVGDTAWNPPVLIHQGIVDPVKGNHSWTRPHFQFFEGKGFFLVNETSDGSVKNTYNAVQLVTFDCSNPGTFTTECVDRVPQGCGAYSSDFLLSSDGWLYCVVEHNGRIYGDSQPDSADQGVFVFARSVTGGPWTKQKVFESKSDAALAELPGGEVQVLRFSRPGGASHPGTLTANDPQEAIRWEVARTLDHGRNWSATTSQATPGLRLPTHIQVSSAACNWHGRPGSSGMFEDNRGTVKNTAISAFNVYAFSLKGAGTR